VRANTTVVVPAHNAAGVIGGQLAALTAQVGAGDFEVVVALNRCTDRAARGTRRAQLVRSA
jgi:glycosyltransferase involved in cell wall biosynthesis